MKTKNISEEKNQIILELHTITDGAKKLNFFKLNFYPKFWSFLLCHKSIFDQEKLLCYCMENYIHTTTQSLQIKKIDTNRVTQANLKKVDLRKTRLKMN